MGAGSFSPFIRRKDLANFDSFLQMQTPSNKQTLYLVGERPGQLFFDCWTVQPFVLIFPYV